MLFCERREAETGSGGEYPDQGIAGRNSYADNEKKREPPGAFFDLTLEPASGTWRGPGPGYPSLPKTVSACPEFVSAAENGNGRTQSV